MEIISKKLIPFLRYGQHRLWGLLQLLLSALVTAAGTAVAASVDLSTGYTYDLFVTNNWDVNLAYKQPIKDRFVIKGRCAYLDVTQRPISGIVYLDGHALSAAAGITFTSLWNHAAVDAEGGIDIFSGDRISPNVRLSINGAVPVPANPMIDNIRLAPMFWYTQRILNAAAVKNRITSWGIEAEAGWRIARLLDFGLNFRRDNLWPADTLLDSLFLDTITSGRPLLPIDKNAVNSFYVYSYGKIIDWLLLGYAFSWSHSENDQWIATRRTPYIVWRGSRPGETGIASQYAYYPYSTPRRSIAHLFVLVTPVTIGPRVRWQNKIAFPFYSSREQFSSPDSVPIGQEMYYEYYYTQKYTGPLTLETKLGWAVNDRLTVRCAYEYYCLPYRQWSYFTRDSYSYHRASAGIEAAL